MDWTIPLKAQQRDFLARLQASQHSKSANGSVSLLRCQIPGCHREEMVVSGDRIRELRALCRGLILESDPSLPVRDLLRDYLRGQLAREAIGSCDLEAIAPTDSIAQIRNAALTDFTIANRPDLGIRVRGIEGDPATARWHWSAAEIDTSEAIACVLIREPVTEIAEEYHLVLAGFLPSHLVARPGEEADVGIEDLLYSSGLSSYLDSLASQDLSPEDPPTNDWLRPLTSASSYGYPAAIAADGTTLASCGYDGRIQIWKLDDPELSQILAGRTWALSPDSVDSGMSTLGSADNAFEVWHASSGQPYTTVAGPAGGISAIALTPDAQILVVGGFDGSLQIWNLSSGELQHSFPAHTGSVTPIAISSDGRILASGSTDRTIKCWHLQEGKCLQAFPAQPEPVASLAIRSDGGAIAGGFPSGCIKIWDAIAPELKQTLVGHGGCVRGLCFDPDDRLLASSSIERTVKVWDLQGNPIERTLTGHPDPWVTIAPNPDKQRIELTLLRHSTPGW
ncbi:MAG: WD40 repeat domain-containing protein [Cyanobacteriota bacterium]|nr:WD40 repeat domain-containing protein [Cyanobacteriota bacterium]